MEKFFTVKEGSSLYKDFWNWFNSIKKNNDIVTEFFREHEIEATKYVPGNEYLGIVPTDSDLVKFEKQLSKKESNQGLRFFRKNSAIGKAWIERAADMKFRYKPMPVWYGKDVAVGKSSSRLFDYDGTLYCSISADTINVSDDIFTEIKGSEFYKVMEAIEAEDD